MTETYIEWAIFLGYAAVAFVVCWWVVVAQLRAIEQRRTPNDTDIYLSLIVALLAAITWPVALPFIGAATLLKEAYKSDD